MALTRKKRKVMSAAQKKALAKGRAALKAKRSKTASKRKPAKKAVRTIARTITKSKGATMAKRKARKSTSGSVKGRARRTITRARGFLGKHSGAVEVVKNSALAVGGGIAAGVLANKLPITDARIKAAAPIAAGILLAATLGKKNQMINGFATGMVVLGGVALLKQLAPNVPMLAGEQEMVYIPNYPDNYGGEMLQLGLDEDEDIASMGENVQLGEEYFSPADL